MIERMNPEVRLLAAISASLEADYTQTDERWKGSPFGWIRTRPSRQKGAIGEKLVAGWLAARGFNITRAENTDADRIVENKAVEIKFSMLWESGSYTFQQLRDQQYDFAICLGISPFDAHCWVLPKDDILRYWRDTGELDSQHGGIAGSDTCWLTVNPGFVPDWLCSHGGKLRQGLEHIANLTGFTPKEPEADDV